MILAMLTLQGESFQNYGEQTGNVSLLENHTAKTQQQYVMFYHQTNNIFQTESGTMK